MAFNHSTDFYNHDRSSTWPTHCEAIIDKLQKYFPLHRTHKHESCTYMVNTNLYDPATSESFYGSNAGHGEINLSINLTEIPTSGQPFSIHAMHCYGVVAHEYFHVYQFCKASILPASKCHWLKEGTCGLFEALFLEHEYNLHGNSHLEIRRDIQEMVLTHPQRFEHTDYTEGNSDPVLINQINYSDDIFLVLALIRKLRNNGNSLQQSLQKIYTQFYTLALRTDGGWVPQFSTIFGFTPTELYTYVSELAFETTSKSTGFTTEELRKVHDEVNLTIGELANVQLGSISPSTPSDTPALLGDMNFSTPSPN